MRNAISAQLQFMQNAKTRKTRPWRLHILFLIVLASGASVAAGQPPASESSKPPKTSTAVHKSVHPHSRPSAAPTSQAAPVIRDAPKLPDWPVNDHPSEATVLWNSQGLRIEASNSSLSQILKDVATATGTKVEGLSSDERIFGSYGPGPARAVLAELLDGSGYNVLMIGDQGQGTPREIVLSAQTKGETTSAVNNQAASNDENSDADDQSQQPPQLQPPPTLRNGFAPGAPPRTPQQIMQEMQQRQQQLQQGNSPQ